MNPRQSSVPHQRPDVHQALVRRCLALATWPLALCMAWPLGVRAAGDGSTEQFSVVKGKAAKCRQHKDAEGCPRPYIGTPADGNGIRNAAPGSGRAGGRTDKQRRAAPSSGEGKAGQ